MGKGKRAYELHYVQKMNWSDVGKKLDWSESSARNAARRYGKKHGLPTSERELQGEAGVTKSKQDNNLVLTSYSPLINTVEELLAHCQIDLDDWVIVRKEATAWTTPSKDIEKDLEYVDGAATGFVRQSNNMRIAQNVRVMVALVPKHPEAVRPVIQPVQVNANLLHFALPQKRRFVRHFIFSDTHFGFRRRVRDAKLFPFHNRKVLDVILQLAKYCKPNRLDILGDWFDMSEFTDKFIKKPSFYYTLQPAIAESFWWLQQFVCGTGADTRLHEGNHDARLPKAINTHLPFAYGLRSAAENLIEAPAVLSVQNLLALDSLGVEWVYEYPNDRDFIAPRLALAHGTVARANPVETSRAVASGYVSEIFGHIHKREHSTGVRSDSRGNWEVEGWSFACACKTDYTVPGHKTNQQWSNGCGWVDVFDDGHYDVRPVSITADGVACVDGLVFQGEECLEALRGDVPEWNW